MAWLCVLKERASEVTFYKMQGYMNGPVAKQSMKKKRNCVESTKCPLVEIHLGLLVISGLATTVIFSL